MTSELNARQFTGWVTSANRFPSIPAENLGHIRVPTLLILGEYNISTAFEAMSDAFVSHVPGAESVTIPGAGHLAWSQEPEITRRAAGGVTR